jgi:hypothetical protein
VEKANKELEQTGSQEAALKVLEAMQLGRSAGSKKTVITAG